MSDAKLLLNEIKIKEVNAVEPSKEPALKVGTATGTVAGLVSLLLAFNPNLITEKQTLLILVVAAFLLPIITAISTRKFVWSPASVIAVLDEAVKQALEARQKDRVRTFLDKPPVVLGNSTSPPREHEVKPGPVNPEDCK
jgi:hypothetical protein